MISLGNYFGYASTVTVSDDMALTLNDIPTRSFCFINTTGVSKTVTIPAAGTVSSRWAGMPIYFYNVGADDVVLDGLDTLSSGEMLVAFLAVDSSGSSWEPSSVKAFVSS